MLPTYFFKCLLGTHIFFSGLMGSISAICLSNSDNLTRKWQIEELSCERRVNKNVGVLANEVI